jgi:nucleoside-diphosphate-sugar epimerase
MRLLVTGGSGFIGTHLLEHIRNARPDAEILNIDLQQPKLSRHLCYWRKVDILDRPSLIAAVRDLKPTHLVHMAARTDPDGTKLDDYRVNIDGSANVLEAIKTVGTLRRNVFYSTQYVVRPGSLAIHDREYRPVNVYGESKSKMEELIRSDPSIPGIWTIVRPTNIWGPWHPRYPTEFWLVVKKGLYIHPGGDPVVRAYGYVENVADFTVRILEGSEEMVGGKTFWLGDPVGDIKQWADAFSQALTGRDCRIVPRSVLRAIALAGDLARKVGRSFPLFTDRYRSMTQSYIVDMKPTYNVLGMPQYQLEEGVKRTVEWLRTQGDIWNL